MVQFGIGLVLSLASITLAGMDKTSRRTLLKDRFSLRPLEAFRGLSLCLGLSKPS